MDIPELTNFKPRASTSTSQSSHTNHYADDFPLDPQLFSTNSTQQPRPDDQYWSSQGGGRDTSDEEEDEEDEDEDEDEEEEEEQQQQQGLKRRAVTSLKGKEKAINQDQDDDVSDEEAEAEDLGRFIQAIRNSNSTGVGGQTLLDEEFDRSIQQELNTTTRDNNQDDLFEDDVDLMEDLTVGVKGRKRGRRRSQRRGRRAAGDVEPSPEVQRLLFQANEHYSLGEYDQAIELLEEVIRIDPILKVTWYTLATIYEDRNQREKSIQCKIVATHLNSSSNSNLNQDWSDLGKESRDLGLLHQAIYCFTQALKHDKGDVNSMWDRAYLLKMSGATKIAIKCFQNLLKLLPHDPGVLRELSPLLSQSRDFYPLAINLLESAFDFYQETVPIVSSETLHLLNSYGYEDLETLTDFLLLEKKYLKVVKVIKRGVRWIQGRALETEWDSYLELDDREFDLKRKERKGWEKSNNSWLEKEPVYELDVRLRTRLGIARLHLSTTTSDTEDSNNSNLQEAIKHFEIISNETDVVDFPELFDAIGDAFFTLNYADRALDFYMFLAEREETNGSNVWFKIGQCYQSLKDFDQAKECFENVIEEEPENLKVKLSLAKVFEQLGQPKSALNLIKQVMRIRQSRGESNEDDEDGDNNRRRKTFYNGVNKSNHASRLALEEELLFEATNQFSLLSQLEERSGGDDDDDDDSIYQWLEIASKLIETFRQTRQLFPSDFRKKFTGMVTTRRKRRRGKTGTRGGRPRKQVDQERDLQDEADEMQIRLQRTMITTTDDREEEEEEEERDIEIEEEETSFRGKTFQEWVDFILKYCFLLVTKSDELELAREVLLHVREASVFRQNFKFQSSLRLGLISCYFQKSMFNELVQEFRWFQNNFPYQTEPVRLLLSLLSKGHEAIRGFNEHRLQKFLIRHLKEIVKLTTTDEQPQQLVEEEDQEEDDEGEGEARQRGGGGGWKPTSLSPVFYTLYGFMLMNSQSFQTAIIYLLRAYSLDPNQPLINLALSTCYLQRAMSRQTDNRQHQISQALAFLSQYKRLRSRVDDTEIEIEYNFGRFFHHLGLQPQAIKHYKLALTITNDDKDKDKEEEGGKMQIDQQQEGELPLPPKFRNFGNLKKVAAYNLMILLAASDQVEQAREISKLYLAV